VDQWLSGDAKPSSEMTFELLNWVEKQRASKIKNAPAVLKHRQS
jgi:hypothetical protein